MAGRSNWNSTIKSINGVPKVRECFWFNVPGSQTPEIPDWHPCVVIRGAKSADEKQHTVTIVPLTSTEPSIPRSDIVKLSVNPNPTDDRPVWALGEFVCTIGIFRLEHYATRAGKTVTPKISSQDLERILDAVVEGITVLKRRVENRQDAYEMKLREEYEAKILAFEKEFEAKVEASAFERLDFLTRPDNQSEGDSAGAS